VADNDDVDVKLLLTADGVSEMLGWLRGRAVDSADRVCDCDCDCDEPLEAMDCDLPHDGGCEESLRVCSGRERELSRFCSLYRGMVDEEEKIGGLEGRTDLYSGQAAAAARSPH
jgi:hypothetical protein